MKIFYTTCISSQHLQAFQTFLDIYYNHVKWKVKVGILVVPDRNGEVPQELFEIPQHVPVMVDNGAYLYDSPLPVQTLVKAVEKLEKHFENILTVLPDVVEDQVETYRLHLQALKKIPFEYRKHFISVIQGKTVNDYIQCFEKVKHIALKTSKVVAVGGLKVKRYRDRITIIEQVCRVVKSYRPHNIQLKVHIFGMDLKTLRKTHQHFDSCDSANWTHNSTTGYGLTVITRQLTIRKINIYMREIRDWTEVLAHELFQYVFLICRIISQKT